MILRPYQRASIDGIFDYWADGGGNPIADLATGTGKSVVIATLVREVCETYPDIRVLMLVHVRELVDQNARAMLRTWPGAPIGINSAGLGRRDKHSRVLFASIQSVAREDGHSLGPRHLVIVDEAHLIPRAGNGQYLTLLNRLRDTVPDLRVVGFTATPYRLDSGRLDKGDEALFSDTVFSYDIGQAVDDGWLAPLVSRATAQIIDVSNVARRGGEFVPGALEAAANKDSVTQAACDEIVERGAERRSWLAFCTGVDHAFAVRDALRQRCIIAETITGETPKGERDQLIQAFRAGRIRCLTNANVLTTGFDAPSVDLIAMLRPTLSTSLYVQMLGRGTRPVYPVGFDENAATAEERVNAIRGSTKPSCLVLDFAQNVRRHGPVDAVEIEGRSAKEKNEEGKVGVDDIRAKECPACATLNALRVYVCVHCGHEWEKPAPKHDSRSDRDAAVMKREIVERWMPVTHTSAFPHHKDGSAPSMRIEFTVGLSVYQEWVLFEHSSSYVQAKARKWWRSIVGSTPPNTTAEAIARLPEISITAIQVIRDGKWWRVSRHRIRRVNGSIFDVDADLNVRPAPLALVPLEAAE